MAKVATGQNAEKNLGVNFWGAEGAWGVNFRGAEGACGSISEPSKAHGDQFLGSNAPGPPYTRCHLFREIPYRGGHPSGFATAPTLEKNDPFLYGIFFSTPMINSVDTILN